MKYCVASLAYFLVGCGFLGKYSLCPSQWCCSMFAGYWFQFVTPPVLQGEIRTGLQHIQLLCVFWHLQMVVKLAIFLARASLTWTPLPITPSPYSQWLCYAQPVEAVPWMVLVLGLLIVESLLGLQIQVPLVFQILWHIWTVCWPLPRIVNWPSPGVVHARIVGAISTQLMAGLRICSVPVAYYNI